MTDIMSVHVFAESATPATAKQIIEQVQSSESTVYVFYSHPSVYVAHGLEQGRSGRDLCDEWLTWLNEAFEVQRKNRRVVRLLCVQDALEQPNVLSEKTGLKSDELTELKVLPEPLALMAGHQLVLQDDNISKIIERLEACTMHLSDQVYRINVDAEKVLKESNGAVAIASGASEELEQTKNTLQKAQEENDQLLAQLQQVQEQLEQQFISKKEVEQEHNDAVARASGTRNDKESSPSSVLDEITEENKLLTSQLQQVQHQLENYFIKYQDSEKQRIQEQLKNKQNSQVDKNDTLLAEKEAEIARLNKQLIKLEMKSINEELTSTQRSSVDKEKAVKPEAISSDERDKIVTPEESANVSQPPKHSLLSRIKMRLKFGKRERSNKIARIKEQVAQLQQTEYFDSAWYLQQYPDLKKAGVNPAEHYLRFGGFESRNPSPNFNSAFYLEQNPDVAQEGINPLLHFVMYGKAEGRLPKPKAKSSSKSGASK